MGMILVSGNYQFRHPDKKLGRSVKFVPRPNDWVQCEDWVKESDMFKYLNIKGQIKWIDGNPSNTVFDTVKEQNKLESSTPTRPIDPISKQISENEPPVDKSYSATTIVNNNFESPDALPINVTAAQTRARKNNGKKKSTQK